MRILVHGSDALGSLLAAELQLAGHDVTVLVPAGHRFEQMRWHGIRLHDEESGAEETVPVTVVTRLSNYSAFDLVLATGESAELEAALPAPPWGRSADILLLPGDADRAARILGEDNVDINGIQATFDGEVVRYRLPAGVRSQGESRPVSEPPGWLPATPPAEDFRQPPKFELPTEPLEHPVEATGETAPAHERPAPKPREAGTLITRMGEGVLPAFPDAAEGEMPWPDPTYTYEHVETEVAPERMHGGHALNWRAVAIATLFAWVVWRMFRPRRG